MEKVNEWEGIGNAYDFGARINDVRLGRWMSVDGLAAKYPKLSLYSFANNSPMYFVDPNGRDIIVAVSNASTPVSNPPDVGHVKIYVTRYRDVQVKVMENGKEVMKTFYVANGYYEIENQPENNPHGNSTPNTTIVTEHHGNPRKSANRTDKEFGDNAANYFVEIDKGVDGTDFDQNLNPNLNLNQKFFTVDEIKNEQLISDDALALESLPQQHYQHGEGCSSQNDCASLVVNYLIKIGKVTAGSDFGKISLAVKGQTYTFYVPNKVGLDLENKLGLNAYVGDWDEYQKMTQQNSEDFMKEEITNELERRKK
jgi:RHS repeat-associated protein